MDVGPELIAEYELPPIEGFKDVEYHMRISNDLQKSSFILVFT